MYCVLCIHQGCARKSPVVVWTRENLRVIDTGGEVIGIEFGGNPNPIIVGVAVGTAVGTAEGTVVGFFPIIGNVIPGGTRREHVRQLDRVSCANAKSKRSHIPRGIVACTVHSRSPGLTVSLSYGPTVSRCPVSQHHTFERS